MHPSTTPYSSKRRALGALGVALGLFVVVLAGASSAVASPAQVPSSSAPATSTQGTPTTTQNLLSSSTPATGATSATGAVTTTTSGGGSSGNGAADDNRRVWYVVGGLVAVALALIGLTIWYWFRTRPTGVAGSGRHGRGSAPVDHDPPPNARVVVPVATEGVATAVLTPPRGTESVTTVPADVRAAALGGRASRRADRRALTTDDAPDHDASDQDWAPRGTGEHDRVEVDRPSVRRPGRSARAAALRRAREDD